MTYAHNTDYISIHALREEGDFLFPCASCVFSHISIHALREEGDRGWWACRSDRAVFLSTPSARRATNDLTFQPIHQRNFYPRPPRGGRLLAGQSIAKDGYFYSRPIARAHA